MGAEGLRKYTPEDVQISPPELRVLPGGNEDLKIPHEKPHLEVISWGNKVKESKPLDRDPKLDDHLWEARIKGVKEGTIKVSPAKTESEQIEELRQKIRLSKENRAWDQQISLAHDQVEIKKQAENSQLMENIKNLPPIPLRTTSSSKGETRPSETKIIQRDETAELFQKSTSEIQQYIKEKYGLDINENGILVGEDPDNILSLSESTDTSSDEEDQTNLESWSDGEETDPQVIEKNQQSQMKKDMKKQIQEEKQNRKKLLSKLLGELQYRTSDAKQRLAHVPSLAPREEIQAPKKGFLSGITTGIKKLFGRN